MGKKNKRKQRRTTQKEPKLSQVREISTTPVGAVPPLSVSTPRQRLHLKGYIAALVTLIGIGGTCGTFYGLRPQPVVVSTISLDDENPFASQFSIMNNGSMDMQNVRIMCFIRNIKGSFFSISNSLSAVVKLPRISAGDTVTVPPFKAQIPESIITESDIALVIKYRQTFYPWRLERIFRLVTVKAHPKGFKWIQQPVDEVFTKALRETEFTHRDRIMKGDWN